VIFAANLLVRRPAWPPYNSVFKGSGRYNSVKKVIRPARYLLSFARDFRFSKSVPLEMI
jgi:hypothetical protein